METKKILGTLLIALGLLGVIPGVMGIFEGREVMGISPWAYAILGGMFFLSGIGLVKTIRGREES